jgi:ribosomal protein S27AE
METVGTYPDLASAQIAQSVLEAEGIPSIIPEEHQASLDWRMSGALGGVTLQVPPEHLERATSVLREHDAFDHAELDRAAGARAPEEPDDYCPRCGSMSIAPARLDRRLRGLAMLFPPLALVIGPIAMLRKRRLVCSSCGHSWVFARTRSRPGER